MSTALTLLRPYGSSCDVTDQAMELKRAALSRSALIGRVSNAQQNEAATVAMQDIRRVIKAVEDARVEIKRPLLDAQRAIDARAKEFSDELKAEDIRLSRAARDYADAQADIARAEQQRVAAEAARIAREQADEARRIQEEAAKEAHGKSDADIVRITQETAAALKVAEERKAQELEAIRPAAMPAKAAGQTVRSKLEWEVTDIHKLYRTNPGLVRLEANRQEIGQVLAMLAESAREGIPSVPGLRIWRETKVGVRLGQEPKAIEV